ncbi:MAG TPA: OB-fold domain-containing protein [Streptomyces sp.]|uniref:Zn-ribbon domain-containing OB-fold protein n=1 Tax=Streptomyces sp. TaxID=1931 RepID=UPI002D3D8BFA|nr:OB-fold domain-containing protein [Streptomyces sp.]HZG02497.1 OB-fold domain-containing protein [Streptomyces sp.]
MVFSPVIDARGNNGGVPGGNRGPSRAHAAPGTARAEGSGTARPASVPEATRPAGGHLDPGRDGLYFQRCRWCRTAVFRRLLCPVCASTSFDWEPSSGTGVIRRVLSVDRSTGTPRNVVMVTMDEGYQLRSTVIGTPPEAVCTGARVRLAPQATRERREPVFRLCDGPYADRLSAAWH